MVLQATEHMQLACIQSLNICYDVTDRMTSTHEISYNLMQRNTPGLADSIFKIHLDKWLVGSIAQYLFPYVVA